MCDHCGRDDDKRENEERERFSGWGMGVGLLILGWGAFAGITVFRSPESGTAIGQFGDAFGMLNAIFSSIAAAGAVYAVILQGRELRLARIEAKESRIEAAKSAKAQQDLVMLQGWIAVKADKERRFERLNQRREQLLNSGQVSKEMWKAANEVGKTIIKLRSEVSAITERINRLLVEEKTPDD